MLMAKLLSTFMYSSCPVWVVIDLCLPSLLFPFAFLAWVFCWREDNNGSYILLGVQLLMEMLFERSSSGNSAEVAACERVQQKSAVTLARLSRDPEVADAAVKLSCKDVSLA